MISMKNVSVNDGFLKTETQKNALKKIRFTACSGFLKSRKCTQQDVGMKLYTHYTDVTFILASVREKPMIPLSSLLARC